MTYPISSARLRQAVVEDEVERNDHVEEDKARIREILVGVEGKNNMAGDSAAAAVGKDSLAVGSAIRRGASTDVVVGAAVGSATTHVP